MLKPASPASLFAFRSSCNGDHCDRERLLVSSAAFGAACAVGSGPWIVTYRASVAHVFPANSRPSIGLTPWRESGQPGCWQSWPSRGFCALLLAVGTTVRLSGPHVQWPADRQRHSVTSAVTPFLGDPLGLRQTHLSASNQTLSASHLVGSRISDMSNCKMPA